MSYPIVLVVYPQSPFTIELLDEGAAEGDVQVEVQGPDGGLPITLAWEGQTGYGHFTPREPGEHQVGT